MNMELFMEQKWKISIPEKRINVKEREDIMRMPIFLRVFPFTLKMWESVTQLTHLQSLFPSNTEEEEGRLEENYSDPESRQ